MLAWGAALLCATLGGGAAPSPAVNARLAIFVTDVDGAPVPGASVTVVGREEDGSWKERPRLTRVTRMDGEAVIDSVPPGRYRVRVSLSGFLSTAIEDLRFEGPSGSHEVDMPEQIRVVLNPYTMR